MIERTKRGLVALLMLVLILAPAMANAADDHSGHSHAAGEVHDDAHGADAHGAEGHGSGGSLFSVDPGLLIWTIITFLVVLFVLSQTAWKPMMAALNEREQRISGAIDEADRIKSEAKELLARYETMIDKAKDEARGILDEARKDGVAVQEDIRKKAQEEAQDFKERAHKEIELAKDGAIKEIWDQAAGLSTELATRILGRSLDSNDQDRLVRELIDEMRKEAPAGSENA